MKLTLSSLEKGLNWWIETTKWPKDIHNADYYDIYKLRAEELTSGWWSRTVDRLGEWKALRSRTAGYTKGYFVSAGEKLLPRLQIHFDKIRSVSSGEPSVADVTWSMIEEMYDLMAGMKDLSPVFASKMGHFLLPKVFIVMDNVATDKMIYSFYWQGMVAEWKDFADKDRSIEVLSDAIRCHSTQPIHPNYPFETKIMELCHVGEKHK